MEIAHLNSKIHLVIPPFYFVAHYAFYQGQIGVGSVGDKYNDSNIISAYVPLFDFIHLMFQLTRNCQEQKSTVNITRNMATRIMAVSVILVKFHIIVVVESIIT